MRTLRLILGVPAIALIFLPYVWSVSPWATVRSWDDPFAGPLISFLGLPFILAMPIFMVDVQRFLKKKLPRSVRVVFHILAYAALTCLPIFLILAIFEDNSNGETTPGFLIFGIPALIAVYLIRLAGRLSPEGTTLVTLRVAWLPNALICAILFWGENWQIGAWLAAFTIVVYGAEVAVFMTGEKVVSKQPKPLAGLSR